MTEVIYLENRTGHFKFYKMTRISEKKWLAEYGRIGGTALTKIYSDIKWNQKYHEKINKGYTDITGSTTPDILKPSNYALQLRIFEKLIKLKKLILSKINNDIIEKNKSNKYLTHIENLINKKETYNISKSELIELNKIYKIYKGI